MIHLSRRPDDVLRLLAGGPALLLLDYDGTLRETTADPDAAALSPRRRNVLARLAAGPARLAILSGRSIGPLKRLVGLTHEVVYCGNFGLEIEDGTWRFLHPRAHEFEKSLASLRVELKRSLGGFPRLALEDKRWGLVVHYRGVPSRLLKDLAQRLAAVRAATAHLGLRWMRGQRSWEIVPDVGWDKGDAAQLLWRRFGRPRVVALGDGVHDESMFALTRGRGAAVCVGRSRRSQAPYWLKNVPEVYRFLSDFSRALTTRASGAETPATAKDRRRP